MRRFNGCRRVIAQQSFQLAAGPAPTPTAYRRLWAPSPGNAPYTSPAAGQGAFVAVPESHDIDRGAGLSGNGRSRLLILGKG